MIVLYIKWLRRELTLFFSKKILFNTLYLLLTDNSCIERIRSMIMLLFASSSSCGYILYWKEKIFYFASPPFFLWKCPNERISSSHVQRITIKVGPFFSTYFAIFEMNLLSFISTILWNKVSSFLYFRKVPLWSLSCLIYPPSDIVYFPPFSVNFVKVADHLCFNMIFSLSYSL